MRLIQSVKERIMRNGLPDGYTRLEYLESTGTQYIDTNYAFTDDFSWEIDFNGIDKGKTIFGGRTSSTRTALLYQKAAAQGVETTCPINAMTGDQTPFQLADLSSGRHKVKMSVASNKGSVWVDGAQVYNNQSFSGSYISGVTQALFADNFGSGDIREHASSKVYAAKMWQGNSLVRDFVPALDPSNKPCMYDLITKQPYYNLGEGDDFSIGKKLYPVEYIQSTGTQYINTSYKPNNTTRLRMKLEITKVSDTVAIFGARNYSTALSKGFYLYEVYNPYDSNYRLQFGYGSSSANVLIGDSSLDGVLNIDFNKNVASVNNEILNTFESSTFTASSTLLLFNCHTGADGTDLDTRYGTAKIYYCQIWDNDILIGDLIPVRDENNVGYMLNLLTNTLYGNSGTGSFLIGEDTPLIRNVSKPRLIQQSNRELPKGFQEVEYLESSGTQWIDTGVTIDTATDEVELYYQLLDGTVYKWIFGEHDNNARFGLGSGDGADKKNVAYGSTTAKKADSYFYTKEHCFIANSDGVYIDGTKMANYSSFSSTSTIYLFSLNLNATNYSTYTRIWAYRHKRNGVLIRDLVPYLDASGRPCMWDKVTRQPFYNLGTGEFTYGRKIIPVEYLESTGTQYIDIGVKGKNNTSFDYDVIFTQIDSNAQCVGGVYEVGNSVYFGLVRANGNLAYHYDGTASPVVVMETTVANTKYHIEGVMNTGEQYIKVNGTKGGAGTISGTFTSTDNMWLFANNSVSPVYSCIKLYYFKLYDNGTLIRDYIPAIDENNVPYMFDKVTHSVFLNAGTGTFIYGSVLAPKTETVRFVPIIRHLPISYLESTGTQWIDTGIIGNVNTKIDVLFSKVNISDSNIRGIIGARGSTVNTNNISVVYAGGGLSLDFNNSNYSTYRYPDTNSESNIKYRAVVDKNARTLYREGVLHGSNTNVCTDTISTTSMWMFGLENYYLATAKIYYAKIWDNDVLVRDFIPVLKLPEMIPCLYDKVNKVYYYSESADPFLYS